MALHKQQQADYIVAVKTPMAPPLIGISRLSRQGINELGARGVGEIGLAGIAQP